MWNILVLEVGVEQQILPTMLMINFDLHFGDVSNAVLKLKLKLYYNNIDNLDRLLFNRDHSSAI
jgi:hypothetical protein